MGLSIQFFKSINLSGFGCLNAEQRYPSDKSLHSIYVISYKKKEA